MTAAPPNHPPSRYQLAVDQASAYLDPSLPHTNSEETNRWMVQGLMVLDPGTLDTLVAWLLHHEGDIAKPSNWDDWAALATVFEKLVGRAAK